MESRVGDDSDIRDCKDELEWNGSEPWEDASGLDGRLPTGLFITVHHDRSIRWWEMHPRFNEHKTTELAALLLSRAGGRMPYLKLMKLLYLVDREALRLHGSPITGDNCVSMKHGPVLSNTYDMIKSPPEPGTGRAGEFWGEHINTLGYDVVLSREVPPVLSPSDRELVDKVFEAYACHDTWTLAELTHELPEWRDPGPSALPIDYEDILASVGMDEKQASETLSRIRTRALLEDLALRS